MSDHADADLTFPPSPSIEQRIHQVMALVEAVTKDRMNRQFGYHFVGHDDVTLALRRAFVKVGITQRVSLTEVKRFDGGSVGVNVEIEWASADDPQQRVRVASYGEAQSMDRKGAGTPQQIAIATSYAVKLAQLKNFCLVGDDTPDPEDFAEPNPNDYRQSQQRQPPPKPPRGEPRNEKPSEPPPRDEEPSPTSSPIDRFVLGFQAATTLKMYDKVLESASKILKDISDVERAALSDAARVARNRLSSTKGEIDG